MPRMLIVEDQRELREALVTQAKAKGWETVEAIDGQDGLDKIAAEMPDVLIVDIFMPKMNGLVMLDKLQESGKAIPAIVITNLAVTGDVREKLEDLKNVKFLEKSETSLEEICSAAAGMIPAEKSGQLKV